MISKKICLQCGSEDVVMVAGGITGTWKCNSCGYTGHVAEKEIVGSKQEAKDGS